MSEAPVPEIDLEEWRQLHKLTYQQLAARVGLSGFGHARRLALGQHWPDPEVIEQIRAGTGGAVGVAAMHRRRLEYLRTRRPVVAVAEYEIGSNGVRRKRRRNRDGGRATA